MPHFPRWKAFLIWFTVAVAALLALPNAFSDRQLEAWPSWLPHEKVRLGLDLQGGTHIMLKIERGDILKERLEAVVGDIRSALRDANVPYSGLSGSGQFLQVRISDPAHLDAARKALMPLTAPVSGGSLIAGSVTELTMNDDGTGLIRLGLTDQGIDYRVALAVGQSMEVVRRRVHEIGAAEPLIQRQGADRLVVQVPGLQDPQRLKALLNQAARLSFRLVDTSMPVADAVNDRPPATSEIVYSTDDPAIPSLIDKRVLVSGESLVDAQPGTDAQTGEPVVTFRFDTRGTQRLAEETQRNIGRSFAIVLDNQVISTPVISEPILGGAGQFSGSFTDEGASDLAVLLRAGALPATLTVVEERTAGPGVGADSIRDGLLASAIAAVAVVAFMVAFYGLFGVMANIALAANILMIFAILSLAGSTLTLPGIAGIVLTMGMAVDSNVLVYERIREEVKAGRPLALAIDSGFSRAFATIVDANLTTLIAAAVLFFLGSGPVKGFAVTLSIGVVTTVFTAFTMTRLLIAVWQRRTRQKHLPKGIRTGMFDGQNIRFMGIRRHVFVVAGALCLATFVAFAALGLNLGIDFRGGSVVEVQARQGDADLADIRARLAELNIGEVQAQGLGDSRTALIRIQAQYGGENAEQSAMMLVRGELEEDYDFRRVEVVGPAVSSELTWNATIGVIASMLAILVYIWFRFEWQFAIGSAIATLHDVILTLGLFVVTGLEFNLSSIAAILTVVGYSLNDTIVVYDRIRENLRRYEKMPLPVLIDISINQTLSRTVLTGMTTLLALLALYLFGGEVIASFTLAMLFGVIVGTFSSIYIAGPLLIAFRLRPDAFDKGEKKQSGASSGARA